MKAQIDNNVFISGNDAEGYKVFWNDLEVCQCNFYWKALIVVGAILASIHSYEKEIPE